MMPRRLTLNNLPSSYILTKEDREDLNKIHNKWYRWGLEFIHICGKLSEEKSLAGWLNEDECTCCGDKPPEQITTLQNLQRLRVNNGCDGGG